MVKTQWGLRKRNKTTFPQTRTITDTHSAEPPTAKEIFHTKICGMDSSAYFQQPHGIVEKSSIETNLLTSLLQVWTAPFQSWTAPSAAYVTGSHRAAAWDGFSARSLGSSLGCSAALRAAAFKNRHANEKNLVSGTEYKNERFLYLYQVCPFL